MKIRYTFFSAVLYLLVILSLQPETIRAGSFNRHNTGRYMFALIGNTGRNLGQERQNGIDAKLFSLSWRQLSPAQGQIDRDYIRRKRQELNDLREAGFEVILSLGIHDSPAWVHAVYPNSHYRNQYGQIYEGTEIDSGDLNLVFNTQIRREAADYIALVFDRFGSDFVAVRLGGGRYGELTYPPAQYKGRSNCYWAYDSLAQGQAPTGNWKPGNPSPNGEARRFLNWYLDTLVNYQNWQINIVRRSYGGPLMMLYPSWGIRPGDIQRALQNNLNGTTSAEINGEIPRGFDFRRQISAINDPQVIVTTTWLDADASRDSGDDPRYWSPIKYLASLALKHPLNLQLYGENTGHGTVTQMVFSAEQMDRYNLLGMAWFREEELYQGGYATLLEFGSLITRYER